MVCATPLRLALVLFFLSACTTSPPAPATDEAIARQAPADLVGSWDVSLYYAPDTPPSSTSMVIRSVEDGVLSGSFYGTEFSDVSRITQRGDTIAFTAVTADGTGEYLHSGRLEGDQVEGQTLSEGRGFLMTWTAERTAK